MGLPNSKNSLEETSASMLSHKDRLFRLLQVLGPRNVVLPPSLDEPLSRAIDQLECILADHLHPEYQREGAARIPLRVVEPASTSGLQPVQEILDCIPDSHIVTSSDGIIQMANQQAAQLFQRSQQQLTGLSLSTLVAENHWADLLKRLRALNGDVQNWQGEIQITPDSHSPRSVICTLSALRDTGGRLVGAHWLLWDVTEHRHGIMAQEFSHEISQLLLSGVTVEQSLAILCRRLVETFDYPLIWVGMKEVGGTVRILAQSGDHALTGTLDGERWDECEKPSSAVSRAIQAGVTQILQSDQHDASEDVQWLRSQGLESKIVVPLLMDSQVLGVLTICAQQNDAFDSSIAGWLEQLGSHMSKALFLAKDYNHLRLQDKALNYAEHAVCITDANGKIEWVNDAYCWLSGYELGEVIGTILPSAQSKQFTQLLDQAAAQNTQEQSWKVESTKTRKDGRTYTVEETLTPLLSEDGRVSNIVSILQDITSRKEAEASIIHRIYHDPLTDLPNRVMFQDRLEQALAQARRHQRLLAVLFIDLDCFKQVNDECGHRAGDQLLKIIADRLSGCIRATDTVARLSGDEFTLILQDLEQSVDAQHVAQKVLDCVVEPIQIDGHVLHIRTSIGIAIFPTDAIEPEDLLRQADRAMYKAKEQGGQSWAFSSHAAGSCISDPLSGS